MVITEEARPCRGGEISSQTPFSLTQP